MYILYTSLPNRSRVEQKEVAYIMLQPSKLSRTRYPCTESPEQGKRESTAFRRRHTAWLTAWLMIKIQYIWSILIQGNYRTSAVDRADTASMSHLMTVAATGGRSLNASPEGTALLSSPRNVQLKVFRVTKRRL
jgi:hypothetical protein